jgi:hypothetical protein
MDNDRDIKFDKMSAIFKSVEIGQCWICAVLWWPFWKWQPVEFFQCRESIRGIIIYPHIKFGCHRKMMNFYRPFLCRFGSHFENGRHLVKFYVSIIRLPFSKWPPQYCTNSTLSDFNAFDLFFLNLLSVAGLGDFIIVRL